MGAAMPEDIIAKLTRLALEFRQERDWKQFHNPKDMAISLTLEAAEVLELMQWKNAGELESHLTSRKESLSDELADVLYWVLVMAHDQGIDLRQAFQEKLRKNAEKYPIAKSKGSSRKYTEL